MMNQHNMVIEDGSDGFGQTGQKRLQNRFDEFPDHTQDRVRGQLE